MSENNNQSMGDLFPDLGPEVPIISGVAHDSTESLATVRRVPNEPGMAAKVFTMLAEAGVNVDMIVQASASTGTADISFTVPGTAAAKVQEVLQEKQVWTPTRWKPWCTAAPAADSAGFSFPVFLKGMVLRPCPFRLLFTIHAVRCIPCQAVPEQAKGRLRRVGLLPGYGSSMRLTV